MGKLEVSLSGSYKFVMCLVGLCTFGLGAVVMWLSARSWPRVLDAEGITLRSGRRMAWDDLTDVRKVTVVDPNRGRRVTGRLDLVFGRKKARVVPQSLRQGPEVMAFLTDALGQQVSTG